jgi:hypothetical protein
MDENGESTSSKGEVDEVFKVGVPWVKAHMIVNCVYCTLSPNDVTRSWQL